MITYATHEPPFLGLPQSQLGLWLDLLRLLRNPLGESTQRLEASRYLFRLFRAGLLGVYSRCDTLDDDRELQDDAGIISRSLLLCRQTQTTYSEGGEADCDSPLVNRVRAANRLAIVVDELFDRRHLAF